MARPVISKEEATTLAADLLSSDQQPPNDPPTETALAAPAPEDRPKPVMFRTSNVGLVRFPDNTEFAFHKPLLTVTDPLLIEKLKEVASRPKTHIFIHE